MRQIGRPRNPAENALAHMLEDADMLNHCANNLRQSAEVSAISWDDLSEEERERWRTETIEKMREFVSTYEPGRYAPAMLSVVSRRPEATR